MIGLVVYSCYATLLVQIHVITCMIANKSWKVEKLKGKQQNTLEVHFIETSTIELKDGVKFSLRTMPKDSLNILDSNNYRTIMIEQTFAKLFATVLNVRISKYFKRQKLHAKGQAGFSIDYQTNDQTLNFLISLGRLDSALPKSYVVLWTFWMNSIVCKGNLCFRAFGTWASPNPLSQLSCGFMGLL